jgi:hypothetical protein
MRITCPNCESDCLDQGVNGVILCHNCRYFWVLCKEITPNNQVFDE